MKSAVDNFGPTVSELNLKTPVKKADGDNSFGPDRMTIMSSDSTVPSKELKSERIELLRKSIGRGTRKKTILHSVKETAIAKLFKKAPRLLEDFFIIGLGE